MILQRFNSSDIWKILPSSFFYRPAELVAPDLIGCLLVKRESTKKLLWGVIVETEAYSQSEPACHGYSHRTSKNNTLFGDPGLLYVYLTYGTYHCVNIVTEKSDWANGVLLRAIAMPNEDERIASGPGLLANRFGINRSHDNSLMSIDNGIWISQYPSSKHMSSIIQTTRIGISKSKNLPWRWYLKNSRSVSKRSKGDRTPSLLKAWKPDLEEGP